MIREASARFDTKVVQHEEGGQTPQLGRAYGSPYSCARALGLLDREEDLADRSWDRHG